MGQERNLPSEFPWQRRRLRQQMLNRTLCRRTGTYHRRDAPGFAVTVKALSENPARRAERCQSDFGDTNPRVSGTP